MNDISVMAVSLATLATLAALEFFGLRAPIRGGIMSAWGWLTAKALALRSEARLFVAWAFQPDEKPAGVAIARSLSGEILGLWDRVLTADEVMAIKERGPDAVPGNLITPKSEFAPGTSWGPPPPPDVWPTCGAKLRRGVCARAQGHPGKHQPAKPKARTRGKRNRRPKK